MRKVITAIDDVVGKVQFQTDGELVHEVAVSAPIACVEDRTDRTYVGNWADYEDDVTSVNLRNADTFWKGCTPATAEQRWVRSSNAIDLGNGKDFAYVTRNERGWVVRIYNAEGGNTAVRITWLPLTNDGYGQVDRYRMELWRNPKDGKGRLLKSRTLDGYRDLGYDRKDSAGYAVRDQVTRIALFWLAFAAYGN